MASTNKTRIPSTGITHEGAIVRVANPVEQLRRVVMTCLLFEDTFYVDGVEITDQIKNLVAQVPVAKAIEIALEAKTVNKLRHAPLWIAKAVLAHPDSASINKVDFLSQLFTRPDDLTEFLSMYWEGGSKSKPYPAALKKAFAKVLHRFDSYQLGKYKQRAKSITLRDIFRISHPKPISKEQSDVWKEFLSGTLPAPNTWENRMSNGEDPKKVFTDLIQTGKLGGLAFLRNLRKMREVGVSPDLVRAYFENKQLFRLMLPFQFYAAFKSAPEFGVELERAMLKSMADFSFSKPMTLVVDVSGSMNGPLSTKSILSRGDVAACLAMIAVNMRNSGVDLYSFSDRLKAVPIVSGFGIHKKIDESQAHGGTYMLGALQSVPKCEILVVITDEQAADLNHFNTSVFSRFGKTYIINVAPYKNGVGYLSNDVVHINGWSERVFEFISRDMGEANQFSSDSDD